MTRRREVIVHTSRKEQGSVTQGGKDSLKVRKKMKKEKRDYNCASVAGRQGFSWAEMTKGRNGCIPN